MHPNYNSPEFQALREKVADEKIAMVVDRFNNVGKLVFLSTLDPNQKVASSQEELDAKLASIEDTKLPLNCLAVAVMSKVANKEVTPDNALELGSALESQGFLPQGKTAGLGHAFRHMIGKENLSDRAEDAKDALVAGAKRVGGAIADAAGKAKEHIKGHPAAYGAGAAGAAGLAAGAAMGHSGKKK